MRQILIYFFLSLPILVMMTWLYLDKRSIKLRELKRIQLRSQPLAPEYLHILQTEFPLYLRLPNELQCKLAGHIQVFLDEKDIIGRNDLDINDKIRVLIAAQACLLILNRPGNYYPGFRSILVYPNTYVASSTRTEGMLRITSKSTRAGESWHRGPVILAWDHVLQGARDSRDGHNVVMHEFAHKLDEENAAMDGLPLLPTLEQYQQWSQVLNAEFIVQQQKLADGVDDVIYSYGATSPAEFFAVVTETFFEKPHQLEHRHPQLYEQFKQCYLLDPKQWSNAKLQ
ncbi:zinc-dependent peptidase [Paraglaciecola sp. MB-3u-78]|jgi:Mlc titration factor MtfA (ptsG expression regulator)|uniref:M90 family metallopeptidase n=1 Tax=Paraglaciecola sp. MB-3u-78 TaxID=2058332 RepID=UPI000C34ECF6|nr:M90 family metallopeptidase [Paraglaciecola sp. MB-3u-78]PKH00170.1 protein mtfA [Paraglaciecola sp. MB-3u-78]